MSAQDKVGLTFIKNELTLVGFFQIKAKIVPVNIKTVLSCSDNNVLTMSFSIVFCDLTSSPMLIDNWWDKILLKLYTIRMTMNAKTQYTNQSTHYCTYICTLTLLDRNPWNLHETSCKFHTKLSTFPWIFFSCTSQWNFNGFMHLKCV